MQLALRVMVTNIPGERRARVTVSTESLPTLEFLNVAMQRISDSHTSVGRSSCPLLNTLANHGYFPRNGFNISTEQYIDGISKSTNFPRAMMEGLVALGLSTSTTGNKNTFHLDDIDKHNGRPTVHPICLFHNV